MKNSSIKNHCRSTKHVQGKQKLEIKQAREQDIANALRAYNDELHPSGEMLPPNQQAFCAKVVRTFLKAGVPLSNDRAISLSTRRNSLPIDRQALHDGLSSVHFA